jgi:hypothetical protein
LIDSRLGKRTTTAWESDIVGLDTELGDCCILQHNRSFYNQYASDLASAPSRVAEEGGEWSHGEIVLPNVRSPAFDPEKPALTIFFRVTMAYIRGSGGDPHGGGPVLIGKHFGLSRRHWVDWGWDDELFEYGARGVNPVPPEVLSRAMDREWHTVYIRLQDHGNGAYSSNTVLRDWIGATPGNQNNSKDKSNGNRKADEGKESPVDLNTYTQTPSALRNFYLSDRSVADLLLAQGAPHNSKSVDDAVGTQPRKIYLGAHYSNNRQMRGDPSGPQHQRGPLLSMYARCTGAFRDVRIWDSSVSPRTVLLKTEPVIRDYGEPLALLAKHFEAFETWPGWLRIRCLSVVGEFLVPAPSAAHGLSGAKIANRVVHILSLSRAP